MNGVTGDDVFPSVIRHAAGGNTATRTQNGALPNESHVARPVNGVTTVGRVNVKNVARQGAQAAAAPVRSVNQANA